MSEEGVFLRCFLLGLALTVALLALPISSTLAQPSWLKVGGYATYRLNVGCPEGTGEALLKVEVVEVGSEAFTINTYIEQVIKYGSLEGQFYGAVGCDLPSLMSSLEEQGFAVSKANVTLIPGAYSCYEVTDRQGELTVTAWFQEDTGGQ
ncbi:MAG: hypothetical protein DRJ97_07955 [Thermoprotei archaeon]|nr:MAG: hypothetical protein DRJ97_07955 [Thermoprotei archaeon]